MRRAMFAVITALSTILWAAPAFGADSMGEWKRAVAERIREEQSYPRSALARRIEGRAAVAVTINAKGNILDYKIKRETGKNVLDREIPRLVRRLDPLPALPEGAIEGKVTITLPFAWRMQ